jgi:hypothetical protein
VAGDFNLPAISWSNGYGCLQRSDKIAGEFINSMLSSYMTQMVSEPTFGKNYLDLIFYYDSSPVYQITYGPPLGCSNLGSLHCTLIWKHRVSGETCQIEVSRLTYNRGNYAELNSLYIKFDWSGLFQNCSINECYDNFCEIYESGVSKHIPLCKRAVLGKQQPKWFNSEIKLAAKAKFKMFAQLRASSDKNKPSLQKQCNKTGRDIKKLVERARKKFECDLVMRSKKNPRLLFSYINDQRNF